MTIRGHEWQEQIREWDDSEEFGAGPDDPGCLHILYTSYKFVRLILAALYGGVALVGTICLLYLVNQLAPPLASIFPDVGLPVKRLAVSMIGGFYIALVFGYPMARIYGTGRHPLDFSVEEADSADLILVVDQHGNQYLIPIEDLEE